MAASTPRTSGRFLLRVPPRLHRALQVVARAHGLSLNEYCVRRLSLPGTGLSVSEGAIAAVTQAAELFGPRLAGVVAHGSWTRHELRDASDIDMLVVVDRTVKLTRNLYRTWDADPVTWNGRVVDPHFVHLPATGRPAPGIWCEAAVEGVVLFERDDRLSGWLIRVRREIADGRLVRREAHGQPYWTVAP